MKTTQTFHSELNSINVSDKGNIPKTLIISLKGISEPLEIFLLGHPYHQPDFKYDATSAMLH